MADNNCYPTFWHHVITYSCPKQVKNTTQVAPRFRGVHVSQSGAPKGDHHKFQCCNSTCLDCPRFFDSSDSCTKIELTYVKYSQLFQTVKVSRKWHELQSNAYQCDGANCECDTLNWNERSTLIPYIQLTRGVGDLSSGTSKTSRTAGQTVSQ